MQLINRPSASHSNLQSLAQRGQAFSSCTSLPGYASVSSSGGGLDPTPHTQTQQGNSSNTSRNYFSLVVIPYLQGMLPAIAGTGTAPPRRRNLKKSDSFDVEGAEGKASAGSVVLAALGIPVQHRRLVCYALVVFTLALSLAGTAVVVLSPKASVSHANCPARKPHKPADLSTLPQYKGPPVSSPQHLSRFTLVLNSYQRPLLLARSIAHYANCDTVDAIRVVWCESSTPPTNTTAPHLFSQHKEVIYTVVANASLNMRFWPLEGLRTEAVFSVDDDILAPCAELARAFAVWRGAPREVVGFYPRMVEQRGDCSYKYHLGFGTLTWHGAYSIVLTKAAFLHRDYLELYTHHMPHGMLQYIDAAHNCEDIAMQMMVSNLTGRAPVFVHSVTTRDLGKGLSKVKGISSAGAHSSSRTSCVNEFAKYFGGSVPLITRHLKEHDHAAWMRLAPITEAIYGLTSGR